MDPVNVSRRGFLATTAALTGAAMLSSRSSAAPVRTVADQVPLGKTGIMISRLGLGTGSSSGQEQAAEGKQKFADLIHHAFDNGITYFDCAESYMTFTWLGEAMKGLQREKIFLQSKIDGQPQDILAHIDHHRTTYQTDYIDSLLVHCMVKPGWTDQWKRIMDGYDTALERKWIRAKGVSCHTLPALQDAVKSDWTQVNLVRINPKGVFMDGPASSWGGPAVAVDPVLEQIKLTHDKGRGVIGMKIFGNGSFTDPALREKSLHFALNNLNIDAIVIGMKTVRQIDENVALMNKVLAA
jgi:1-deoxyxylulose-5-phosphate synthase